MLESAVIGNVSLIVKFPAVIRFYSAAQNKSAKPHFPYKIGIFNRLFRDKNVGELLNPSKGQSTCTR